MLLYGKEELLAFVIVASPHDDFRERRVRGHGFAEGVDRFRRQGPRQGQGPQFLGRVRSDVFVDGLNGVFAAHEVVDERLNEDRCFRADDVGAEDEFRLFVDD